MIKVSKEEWNGVPNDYKGKFMNYWGDHPEWLGRNVVMSTCITHNPNEPCVLLVEGVDFIIE